MSKNSQSLSTNFFGTNTGTANADIHKIIHKLKMFDQIIFQIDSDQLWFIAAIADRNNSGADVHIAKIVNPMNSGDNLKYLAILTLEFTNLSAENQSKNNQTINNIIARTISKTCDVKITYIIIIWTLKSMKNEKRYFTKLLFCEMWLCGNICLLVDMIYIVISTILIIAFFTMYKFCKFI